MTLIDNFRRAATYADRILKGAEAERASRPGPSQVRADRSTCKTAKALGLDVPLRILQQRADEVIGVRRPSVDIRRSNPVPGKLQ